MKLLTLLFVVGLALTSANPVPSQQLVSAVVDGDELDFLVGSALAEEEDTGTEVGEKVREILDKVLDRIVKFLDDGKLTADDKLDKLIEKMKELRQKLKEKKEELGAKGKELLEKIKEKVRELKKRLENKLREIFGINTRSVEGEKDTIEVVEKVRETLDTILDKVIKHLEEGEDTADEKLDKLAEKFKELRQKLKEKKEEYGVKGKEFFEKLKVKVHELKKRLGIKLREIFGIETRPEYVEEFRTEGDDDAETLKGKFEEIVQRMKDTLEKGKNIKDALEKLEVDRKKLREKKIEIEGEVTEVVDKLTEKFKAWQKKLFDKDDIIDKSKVDFREYLRNIKQWIHAEVDIEKLKEKIEEFYGKKSEISEQLISRLKEKGEKIKEKVLDFISRLLDDNVDKKSDKEYFEKLRQYFKGLKIELKEKYTKFGEWAKRKHEEGLEKGSYKLETVKRLALRYIEEFKSMEKEVRDQGYEFFRESKEDLGSIWMRIQEIRNHR